MSVNLNTIKSVASKVNSKGVSLLRKDVGLSVKNAAKEGLKVPEGAATYDAVRVGRNFKPNESYTDVFTFRNKNGEMINRYTKKVDGDNVVETKKWYENLFPWEKELDKFGDEVMEIPARKVSAFTRENGKISKITEDVYAVTDEPKPYLTHFKREIKRGNEKDWNRSVNYENIVLEQRRNGENAKFIKNQYETDRYNNGNFELLKSETSSDELKSLAENTYFLPFVSKKNKFANRIAQAAIQDANFIDPPQVNLYKMSSDKRGFFDGADVNINLKSSRDLGRPRESITETVAHEVSHSKWDEKCTLYDFYESGMDYDSDFLKLYSKADIPDIKKYRYSIDHYIRPDQDYKKYLDQFCERVARKDGSKGVSKYKKLEKQIDTEFPNHHGFQFYPPAQNEDDLQGLFSILRAMD